ncbi:MAG: hypothetical protein JWN29_2086 [Acidimicrobiales bacterium]|nr:hypothetical protein [Acidimicrobiales bacterium]
MAAFSCSGRGRRCLLAATLVGTPLVVVPAWAILASQHTYEGNSVVSGSMPLMPAPAIVLPAAVVPVAPAAEVASDPPPSAPPPAATPAPLSVAPAPLPLQVTPAAPAPLPFPVPEVPVPLSVEPLTELPSVEAIVAAIPSSSDLLL